MKKAIISAILCVAMCLCLVLPAFAAEGQTEAEYTGNTGSEDVKVTINGDVIHVYSVDIEFNVPTFTYSTGSKWDPNDYQYKPSETATWSGEGSVKITNHSDLPVSYTVEKANVVNTYGPLDIVVANGTGTIAKCEVGTARGSKNATATFKVDGTPTVSEITAQKLGEIKVSITK